MTTFDIGDYGAIGDGRHMNTAAFAAAISAAAAAGGGTVRVPPGIYLTGTIRLRGRVTLHLEPGARILGSPDLADYEKASWGHHDDRTPYHLVLAEGERDIAIAGDGEINGNGEHFLTPQRPHEWAFYPEIPMRPSPMIELSRCDGVRVENVTLRDPGGWTLHLHDCDRAAIRGIRIENSLFWPNSDGIDLTGCRDTTISDCRIHTGDDAIALKTTADSRSCERIVVSNCVLETSCAALRLGFESDRAFRHCAFSNIAIRNCSRGIDLVTFAGGDIEDIALSNIVGRCMSGWMFDRPIEIYSGFANKPYKVKIPEHPNHGKRYPDLPPGAVRGVSIVNFDMETCGRILMGAAPNGRVEDVSLDHVRLRYPMLDDPAGIGARVGGKSFFPDLLELRAARAALAMQNVRDVRVRDYRVAWPTYPIDPARVELLRSPNRMADPGYYGDMDRVLRGANAPPFHAIWAKNATGAVETRGLTGSADGVPPLRLDPDVALTPLS